MADGQKNYRSGSLIVQFVIHTVKLWVPLKLLLPWSFRLKKNDKLKLNKPDYHKQKSTKRV
jgi:hypothetical protein